MSDIQPIPTRYKGYHFRSRLEARWAVFFDVLGIEWEYEPEGLEITIDWAGGAPPSGVTVSGKTRYLPDFWLPQVRMFAEVKRQWPTPNEIVLCAAVAGISEVLILDGTPAPRIYFAVEGMELNHTGWGFNFAEYDITEGHRYWASEGRFYSGSQETVSDLELGRPAPTVADGHLSSSAVAAARSARFEFGESGAT